MNQSSLFSTGSSLPEPNWQPLSKPTAGGPITSSIDAEAKQLVIKNLGRKWTRKHDVAYVAYMVRNNYLPADALEQAREEYREERATAREHRREAGHPPNHGIRIW